MAIVRWLLLGAVVVLAAVSFWTGQTGGPVASDQAPRFYCPMHPQIRSAQPGTCPICFMKLEPIPAERLPGSQESVPEAGVAAPGQQPAGLAEIMLGSERRQAIGIATVPVTRKRVARELRLPALVEAPERAVTQLRVRTPGFVERVAAVESGQTVRAGQPLVWVYSPELLRAQEELVLAARLSGTAPPAAGTVPAAGGGGTAPAADRTPHHELGSGVVQAARERLALLGMPEGDIERILRERRSERLVAVRAPAAGVVTQRRATVGMYATPEELLFEITDLSRLWVSATVSTEDLPVLRAGMRGRYLSRSSAGSHEVEATLVEPQVAAATRTGRIRFTASNRDATLRPGDIGEVLLSLAPAEHLTVPRDAVIDAGNLRYVFVETGPGRLAPRVVATGPLIGDERILLGGVDAGARVVARGAFLLDSESRLQHALTPDTAAGAPAGPGAGDAGTPHGAPR
jgi:hypothetical protein